ncbi:MAG: Rpn family recombination-promoting nuclease/putative transposase [Moorea sp. SIOASIH]|uniref:Rpn family recombination-promoting nuclease/putative transposase n=1 Tax=Moorena sp. SIOASIH TaxID=2607817 RepID=UPI0013BBADB6|nr:Rpn family recombination-promoting nuclease/putative transposase [Moorena sp. SIOASIH]NEO41609.1 Rpn family recombination-promoting nuclease/putative transposase [Moorena sp. SIOASIH]
MVYYLKDKYIILLTAFGFKRVFGTEENKALLIDFLNTLLPPHHEIEDVTFKNTDKVIFEIYCQAKTGESFIVQLQKANHNFFNDRSAYYSTFPLQEQAQKGDCNYQLKAVYTVGVLDFVFDDHRHDETILHTVELKNQDCQVFYDKLKFLYIELPKFTKTLDQLETHFDKWLFVLKNLSELNTRPQPFQESVFNQLFDVAEIANFSRTEQDNYQNSLKYYRDMNNIVETSRQEGLLQGREEGLQEGREEGLKQGREEGAQRERALILRLLSRSLGEIPSELQQQIRQLSLDQLEGLSEALLDFYNVDDLRAWLNQTQE